MLTSKTHGNNFLNKKHCYTRLFRHRLRFNEKKDRQQQASSLPLFYPNRPAKQPGDYT